jgi:hypothetical protein
MLLCRACHSVFISTLSVLAKRPQLPKTLLSCLSSCLYLIHDVLRFQCLSASFLVFPRPHTCHSLSGLIRPLTAPSSQVGSFDLLQPRFLFINPYVSCNREHVQIVLHVQRSRSCTCNQKLVHVLHSPCWSSSNHLLNDMSPIHMNLLKLINLRYLFVVPLESLGTRAPF